MGAGGRYAPAALPPGKTQYPLCRRLGGSQSRSGRVRKVSPQSGSDPRTVQPVASRYTDWDIPELFVVEISGVHRSFLGVPRGGVLGVQTPLPLGTPLVEVEIQNPVTGLVSLLCGAGNFGNIWSACRQHKIHYTELEVNKYTYL
jgi:hypothetical protein